MLAMGLEDIESVSSNGLLANHKIVNIFPRQ